MAIISVLNFIYFATIIISESCFSITDRAAVYLFISISIYILLSDVINGKKSFTNNARHGMVICMRSVSKKYRKLRILGMSKAFDVVI